MRQLCQAAVAIGLSLTVLADRACAGPILGPASPYNIFVLGDATLPNSDAQGRVAVGGNATCTNYTIGDAFNGIPSLSLVVGGDLNYTNGTIYGSAYVTGAAHLSGVTLSGGSLFGPPTASPINFAAAQSLLAGTSASLTALPTNGSTMAVGSQLSLTGTSPTLNVFDIPGSLLAAASSLTLTAPAGSTQIVNIDGSTDVLQNMGMTLVGTDPSHVLYNFSQATHLTIQDVMVEGSILAPQAVVGFQSGAVDGTIVADSLGSVDPGQPVGEAHNFPFLGSLAGPPAVPEPATLTLAAVGALGLCGMMWKEGRKSVK